MPLYEFHCRCGATREELRALADTAPPACEACGAPTERVYTSFAIGGGADAGPSPRMAPMTWEETGHGDRQLVTDWRRRLEHRAGLEERHPELRVERRPLRSHEGPDGIVEAGPPRGNGARPEP